MPDAIVSGAFDDFGSIHMRFLEEASRLGRLSVLLWDDGLIRGLTGSDPKFSLDERRYFLESLRWVSSLRVLGSEHGDPDRLPLPRGNADLVWAVPEAGLFSRSGKTGTPLPASARDPQGANADKAAFCEKTGIAYRVISRGEAKGFPRVDPASGDTATGDTAGPGLGLGARKRVMATGSFDWLHTGHIRFFEEASARGELSVVVGHDANIRLLKGEGHPLIKEEERLYMVASIRFVHSALVSSGHGWLDAGPEIEMLGPDEYVVNADGDKEEKRRYCEEKGIRYVVLERKPRIGLPARSSTDLRGF